jgi:hypothetical protein
VQIESAREASPAGASLVMRIWPILRRVSGPRLNLAGFCADAALTAFAAGLQDVVDLDSIRADLATVVH